MEVIVKVSLRVESCSLMKFLIRLAVDKDITASQHSVETAVPGAKGGIG